MASVYRLKTEKGRVERAALYCLDDVSRRALNDYLGEIERDILKYRQTSELLARCQRSHAPA